MSTRGGDTQDLATAETLVGKPSDQPRASLQSGDVLAERYRIDHFIDAGGMGQVYAAFDLVLTERVALKILRVSAETTGAGMEQLRREIQLARQVTHPNVCRTFDVGFGRRPDGTPLVFLTMELLDGETLATRLERGGPMGAAAARPLVRQMAAALQAAHDAGVIHRDLKCANVVLTQRGGRERAVITDFGLAASEQALEAPPAAGTPAYMAPEQVEGRAAGPPADVYALGVVMFEMATGKRPFNHPDRIEEAKLRLQNPAPSPLTLLPSLDPDWARLIERCLERDPSARPSTVELLDRLGGSTQSLPSFPARGRGRWLWALAASLLLIGGGVAAARFLRQPKLPSTALLPWLDGMPRPAEAAARRWDSGLAKLRANDTAGARPDLEEVARLDPESAAPHAALAEALVDMEDMRGCADAADQALRLGRDLSRDQRLAIEGRRHFCRHEFQEAIDSYRALTGFFPNHVAYGLTLINAEIAIGRARDALPTLVKMRQLDGAGRFSIEIDLAEARIAEAMGDYRLMMETASRARVQADRANRLVKAADARLDESTALWNLGKLDQAAEMAAEAERRYHALEQKFGEAYALKLRGIVRAEQGRAGESLLILRRAQSALHAIGSLTGEGRTLNSVGIVLESLDRPEEARAAYEEGLALLRQSGDDRGVATMLSNLADSDVGRGDLAGGLSRSEQAMAMQRLLGDESGVTASLSSMAETELWLGRLGSAQQHIDQALTLAEKTGNQLDLGYALWEAGRLAAIAGDGDTARRRFQSALELRQASGQEGELLQTRLSLVELTLAEAHAADAAEAAGAVIAKAIGDERQGQRRAALLLLGMARLDQGRRADAQKAFDDARVLSMKEHDPGAPFELIKLQARLAAARGERAAALRDLETASSDAHRRGIRYAELGLRLWQGRLSPPAQRRALLQRLAAEASALGYHGLEREALSK